MEREFPRICLLLNGKVRYLKGGGGLERRCSVSFRTSLRAVIVCAIILSCVVSTSCFARGNQGNLVVRVDITYEEVSADETRTCVIQTAVPQTKGSTKTDSEN